MCFLLLAKFLSADIALRRRAFYQLCLVLAAIVLAWIAVLAWLAAQGSLAITLQILFVYPREYAALSCGGIFSNVLSGWFSIHKNVRSVSNGFELNPDELRLPLR